MIFVKTNTKINYSKSSINRTKFLSIKKKHLLLKILPAHSVGYNKLLSTIWHKLVRSLPHTCNYITILTTKIEIRNSKKKTLQNKLIESNNRKEKMNIQI